MLLVWLSNEVADRHHLTKSEGSEWRNTTAIIKYKTLGLETPEFESKYGIG